jgi:hypothetical protein
MELGHHTAAGDKVVKLEIIVYGLFELLKQLRMVHGIALNIPKDLFVLVGNPGANEVIHCSRELTLTN